MDDSCVVCAETLQWVAYGPCGHQEVCSTCIIRLRFICGDSHCCLCKSESKIIFVTKALGDYTKMINDFSVLPDNLVEGQLGPYWYHEGTQAFFDDVDHYKMIKAMCRLSCSLCNKINEPRGQSSKRKGQFRNVEQLKTHLFHRHGLYMCNLCLEGRKVFICEQKLYTKAQLDRHTKTGDSEVDGSESERGGFNGHPMCEFCKNPFYGENELYMHMSTEHFTCHICERQHPGQYEYFNKYDDLEIHYQQTHFLCKDEACLAKKFVVFATEFEMKRHNAKEHGGNMSRSRRNAALQIPISFRCRRSNEEDHYGPHGGGRGSYDSADNELSLTIQASVDTANAERFHNTPSGAQSVFDRQGTRDSVTIVGRFETLASTEIEASSRGSNALRENSRNQLAEESAFPPLPRAQTSRQQRSRNDSERLGNGTMASRVRRQNTVTVLNSSSVLPTARRQPKSAAGSSHQIKPFSDSGPVSSSSSSVFTQSPTAVINVLPSGSTSSGPVRQAPVNGFVSSNFCSTRNATSTSKVGHSTPAPNLVDKGSINSEFPTVSATQTDREPASSERIPKVGDVQTANKSLVEKVRNALEFDENKYATFKEISAKYRKDLINTGEYLACVDQFGLSHLVLELARLCPDAEKQRELIETYKFNMKSSDAHGGGKSRNKTTKKGKEKCVDNDVNNLKVALQSIYKPPVNDASVSLKDGYQSSKGKSIGDEQINLDSGNQMRPGQNGSQSAGCSSKKNLGTGEGGNKQRKKVPKFLRNRLGNDAVALLEHDDAEPGPGLIEEKTDRDKEPPEQGLQLPVSGVWKNGGGRRLVKMTMRNPSKR